MKHLSLYIVSLITVLTLSQWAYGMTAVDMCVKADQDKTSIDTNSKLVGLVTNPASAAVDDNGRHVICWKGTVTPAVTPTLTGGVTPVTVVNLKLEKDILLSATGPILFQNLAATGIKGSLQFQNGASILTGTIDCDASMNSVPTPTPSLVVSGVNGTFKDVAITKCDRGIRVTGSANVFSKVSIKAPANASLQGDAFDLAGNGNTLKGIDVAGYANGVIVSGISNLITRYCDGMCGGGKDQLNTISGVDGVPLAGSVGVTFTNVGSLDSSTVEKFEVGVLVSSNQSSSGAYTNIHDNIGLSGTKAAVAIQDGVSPVTVSQNTLTSSNKIVYLDALGKILAPSDPYAAAHQLLDVTKMGKHVSINTDMADDISGLVMYPSDYKFDATLNPVVEMFVADDLSTNFSYSQSCSIVLAQNELKKNEMIIPAGQAYFDCSGLSIALVKYVRFETNTPTASLITDAAKVGDITVIITPGQIPSGEGGGLTDSGSASGNIPSGNQGDLGNGNTGSSAQIPDTSSIGEGVSDGGGSNMTSGAMVMGGDVAPSAAGMSAGCGGQMMPGIPAQPGVILWWLVPMATLWYRRNRK